MQYTIIYMAAGNSRRFGKNKLLQEFQGKALYRHGLDLLLKITAERESVRLIVITQYREILETVEKYKAYQAENGVSSDSRCMNRIFCFLNPESRKGAAYTIKRGIQESLESGLADYFLFVAADQPFLGKSTLEQFFQAGETDGKRYPVYSAAYGNQPGNPVMFREDLAEELLNLQEDEGGRKVWRRYAGWGRMIQVRDIIELQDVDVPGDFENISTGKSAGLQNTGENDKINE